MLSDYVPLSNNVQLRFIAEDLFYDGDNSNGGSIVEAAVDDVLINAIYYDDCNPDGDVNVDGSLNVLDVVTTVNAILDDSIVTESFICSGDMNRDLVLNVLDIVIIVGIILD